MTKNRTGSLATVPHIEGRILVIRGQKEVIAAEMAEVVANCDHLARLKFSRTLPCAFTETAH